MKRQVRVQDWHRKIHARRDSREGVDSSARTRQSTSARVSKRPRSHRRAQPCSQGRAQNTGGAKRRRGSRKGDSSASPTAVRGAQSARFKFAAALQFLPSRDDPPGPAGSVCPLPPGPESVPPSGYRSVTGPARPASELRDRRLSRISGPVAEP